MEYTDGKFPLRVSSGKKRTGGTTHGGVIDWK